MDTCYVEPNALHECDACLFKGHFFDKQERKVGVVLPPDSFFKIPQMPRCQNILRQSGLDGYFSLPPWGVDVQRAYELMTTIDDDGVARITSKEGEEIHIKISEEMISAALQLPHTDEAIHMPFHLSEAEKNETFMNQPGQALTFKDLRHPELNLSLRLYSQHFALGKPQRYTLPQKRIANFMRKAIQSNTAQPGDYSKTILADIINHKKSKGIQTQPHLGAGLMLTRIAYQAIGMIDELRPPLSMEEAREEAGPVSPQAPSIIIPPREAKKKKLYKGGVPVQKASKKTAEGTSVPEEPSVPAHSEQSRRMEENLYKALKKEQLRKESSKQQTKARRTEPVENPEIRTKFRLDPQQIAREKRLKELRSKAALGKSVVEEMLKKGTKRAKATAQRLPYPHEDTEEEEEEQEELDKRPPKKRRNTKSERDDEEVTTIPLHPSSPTTTLPPTQPSTHPPPTTTPMDTQSSAPPSSTQPEFISPTSSELNRETDEWICTPPSSPSLPPLSPTTQPPPSSEPPATPMDTQGEKEAEARKERPAQEQEIATTGEAASTRATTIPEQPPPVETPTDEPQEQAPAAEKGKQIEKD